MNRQEAFEVLNFEVEEAEIVCLEDYCDASEKEQAGAFIRAVERLKQPLTLAEFLGWEEGVEYKCLYGKYKVVDGELLYYWSVTREYEPVKISLNRSSILTMREGEKFEGEKYYAKVKGWQLIPNGYYYLGLDGNHDLEIKDACDAYEFTKREWADLGITDENADFEEMVK